MIQNSLPDRRLTVRMYGGVHHDPGSRRAFLNELAKNATPPHFVAVEWDRHVFELFAAHRPAVQAGVARRWPFLSATESRELASALAWEGDACLGVFPDVKRVWLEDGHQGAATTNPSATPDSHSKAMLSRLTNPCDQTMREFMQNAPQAPEPTTFSELVRRVWEVAWSDQSPIDLGTERDRRWAKIIMDLINTESLLDGWIAVVSGWQHAAPEQAFNLCALLLAHGFDVHSIRLGP